MQVEGYPSQFWWAWPNHFQRYCYFNVWPNFPKNGIGSKKLMQLEGYVKCMQANFDRRGLSDFGDFAPFIINFLKKYKLCVPVSLMNITQMTHYKI